MYAYSTEIEAIVPILSVIGGGFGVFVGHLVWLWSAGQCVSGWLSSASMGDFGYYLGGMVTEGRFCVGESRDLGDRLWLGA